MQGLHESIKVVEARYGMTLATSNCVIESITNRKMTARVYTCKIPQSLFKCTRQLDIEEYPFFQDLKSNLNL